MLIDDARYFLTPPPPPKEISAWPRFDPIMRARFALSDVHEVMVVNDVIISSPVSIQSEVMAYARARVHG
jgi:hypothetical protein